MTTRGLLKTLRSVWWRVTGRCEWCGKRAGEEGRYGVIRSVHRGMCNQSWEWGDCVDDGT